MVTRRQRGFVRTGDLGPADLGLPAERGRAILLDRAWSAVAGAAVAGRARAVAVRRGVLEVHVPEGPWAEALAGLIPRLAGRLSARHPELGVRKLRLVRGNEKSRAMAVEAGVGEAVPVVLAERAARETRERTAGAGAPDLHDLMRRYLARAAARGSGGGPSA